MAVKTNRRIAQAEPHQLVDEIKAALKSKIQAITTAVAMNTEAEIRVNAIYAQASAERRNLPPDEIEEANALAHAHKAMEAEYDQLTQEIKAALKSQNMAAAIGTTDDYTRAIMDDIDELIVHSIVRRDARGSLAFLRLVPLEQDDNQATQGRPLRRPLEVPAQSSRSAFKEPPLSRPRPAAGERSKRKHPATRLWTPPAGTAIKALRSRLGFSQAEFAARYGLNLRALQNWEQERTEPDLAAVVLLGMIDRDPETVARLIDEISAGKPDAAQIGPRAI